jgi:Rieske Fe-S protein
MDRNRQTRREFCTHACRAASIAAFGGVLGTVLEGCGAGGGPTSPSSVRALPIISATPTGGSLALTIDAASPLSAVGSAALVEIPGGYVLVAHVADTSFTAFNGTCTHQACTITGYGSQTFVCPCHGSQFSTSGKVLNGPASVNLSQYQTRFADGVLTITG